MLWLLWLLWLGWMGCADPQADKGDLCEGPPCMSNDEDPDTDVAPAETDEGHTDETEVSDLDADGAIDAEDCAPDDPARHPGAAELCDGIDQDCDGVVDGPVATYLASSGVVYDLTAALTPAAPGDVAVVPIDEDGELVICPGTWSVQLRVTAPGVTVTGRGEGVVLDGGEQVPPLWMQGGGLRTVRDLAVRRGRGSGLRAEGGEVVLERVDFEDNWIDAEPVAGGALHLVDTTLRASDCTFTHNLSFGRALFLGRDLGGGGVVYGERSHITFDRCRAERNMACAGSVAYLVETTFTDVDGVWIDNDPDCVPLEDAAGVFAERSDVTLRRTEASDNQVEGLGVLIQATDSEVLLEGVSFHDNGEFRSGASLVSVEGGDLRVVDATIRNNEAFSSMFSIYLATWSVERTLIEDNRVRAFALALDLQDAVGQVDAGTTIRNNSGGAAAIVASDSTLQLDGRVEGNISAGLCGGVTAVDSDVTITGVVHNNQGTGAAGVRVERGSLLLDGAEISANVGPVTAGWAGGVVALQTSLVANNARIIDNVGDAGGLIINSGTATFVGGEIRGNQGGRFAGGLWVKQLGADPPPDVLLDGVIVADNTSGGSAGGCFMEAGALTMIGGALEHNVTSGPGGGGWVLDGEVVLDGVSVLRNSASEGGGLRVEGGVVALREALVQGNSADRGGGVLADGGEVEISGGTLRDNVAIAEGGGVCVDAPGRVVLQRSQVGANLPEDAWSGLAYIWGGRVTQTCDGVVCQ